VLYPRYQRTRGTKSHALVIVGALAILCSAATAQTTDPETLSDSQEDRLERARNELFVLNVEKTALAQAATNAATQQSAAAALATAEISLRQAEENRSAALELRRKNEREAQSKKIWVTSAKMFLVYDQADSCDATPFFRYHCEKRSSCQLDFSGGALVCPLKADLTKKPAVQIEVIYSCEGDPREKISLRADGPGYMSCF
jgi:hypothetical protein